MVLWYFIYYLFFVSVFSIDIKTGLVSTNIWFYSIGLGDKSGINNQGWEILTLNAIRKVLGHTQVNITNQLPK